MSTTDDLRWLSLEASLTNHTPDAHALAQIEMVRGFAKELGRQIIASCPDGRERSLALTHLEESTMWAVKSVVLADHFAQQTKQGMQRQVDAL